MTARRIDTQAIHAGQAAETLALLPIIKLDDEIVSANNLYGGTCRIFYYIFPKAFCRFVKFVDSIKPEAKYALDRMFQTA